MKNSVNCSRDSVALTYREQSDECIYKIQVNFYDSYHKSETQP